MCQGRQAHGRAATWPDLAAQQPMIRKMYGLISATGDSANRVLKRVPELPSTANDRHQQQPANMKLRRALKPRATHENTLLMRRSSGLLTVRLQLLGGLVGLALAQDGHGLVIDGDDTGPAALGRSF